MKRIITALILAVVASGTAIASTVDKPARVVSIIIKRAVIVEAVYPETRELKLLDSQGNRFRVTVDELVPDFDKIEPRDRIVAEYLESVALIVAPHDSEPLLGDDRVVEVGTEADKPVIRTAETRLVVATIESINVADRMVSIRTEDGYAHSVKVSDEARLDLVDVGDQVRLRVTTALAVAVQRPDT
jgi:hypothetical protein